MKSTKRKTISKTLSITIGAIASISILPQTAQAQFIQRSFLNPSFEQNLTPYPAKPTSPGITTISSFTNCFIQVDQTSVPGWSTTHPRINGSGNCSGYVNPNLSVSPTGANLIELWTRNFNGVVPPNGNVFAELNAEANSKLFQNLCLINGETITFSVNHRGRSSASTADVASFVVNNQRAVQFGTASDGDPRSITTLSPSNVANITTNPLTLPGGGWVRYSGSLRYTGVSGTIPVGFEAISTAGGNLTIGNFIDNTQFAGLPVIEIAAQTGNAPESEGVPTTNPPQIRVVGLVGSSGLDITITVQPSSTATLGLDFQFQGGFISTGNTVTLNIPAGNYDGTAATGSLINIPIEIIQDQESEGNETIEFVINADPTKFFNLSTTTCGAAPITSSIYTIFDDEFLSGTVWNDVDNSANNTFTNIQTGSEVGTNADGLLKAILVDSNGNVLASAPVQPDGTYTFNDVPFNTNVRIRLSTGVAVVGNPAPAASLPSGWGATSPLETDLFNSSNNIQGRDFGIRNILPQLLLLKRITQITAVNGNITNFSTIIPSDGTNHEMWPANFVVGEISTEAAPGDIVEYTIYFLNKGISTAAEVKICDPLSRYLTYLPDSYDGFTPVDNGATSTEDLGIKLNLGSDVYLTSAADGDRGRFFSAYTEATGCTGVDNDLTPEQQAELSGIIRVNLATVQSAAYGYIRFRARVK
ncbi:DUF11 domain-containing protein [Synechococcus sp. BDU 130192]|uniref:DUF11 domain-containing protein n=1 Tax=Synechococcus sp. BDU 130192 TaxID=2042059 RepID=UPI000C0884C7|nr:DUF11 domain-containing protein [Synechococcus sp. BDU 130192]